MSTAVTLINNRWEPESIIYLTNMIKYKTVCRAFLTIELYTYIATYL